MCGYKFNRKTNKQASAEEEDGAVTLTHHLIRYAGHAHKLKTEATAGVSARTTSLDK